MRSLAFVSVLALCTASFAQLPDLNPPAEVKKFDWLVGTWTGEAKFNFGGMELDVRTKMTVSYEGQFLRSVSLNDYGMIQATETMYLGWDAARGEYVSWSFSNMAPLPRIERGKLEGDKLVMVSDPWGIMGQDVVSRGTIAKISDSKASLMLEMKAGDSWEQATEIQMTKGSAQSQ